MKYRNDSLADKIELFTPPEEKCIEYSERIRWMS